MAEKRRVGIVTSGGDAPGMNAAIRAVFRCVKERSADHEIVLFKNGFNGLAGRLDMDTDVDVQRKALRDILNRGGTTIGTGRVAQLLPVSPDDPDAEAKHRARKAFLDVAAVNLYQLRVDGLVVIGGDGSFKGGQAIAHGYRQSFERPLRVVGIPATIDNDIYGTDYTIGFDTALTNTVDALRKIRDTVESHRRAIILEVMGNSTGWIALNAGIAGGASTICIPEIAETYDPERIVQCCIAALRGDYRYFIIVMAEGVKEAIGDPDFGNHLCQRIEQSDTVRQLLGKKMNARYNVIGHLARGGTPTAFDNVLAARFAQAAVRALFEEVPLPGDGDGDVAVALQGRDVVHTHLTECVAHGNRYITPDDELYRLSQALTVQPDQGY
ncbi:MAG: ATP-dependent 6-phosphofructokinase [Myxococcota bacterium]